MNLRAVNAFYEARPFPGYAPGDDASSLLDRCRASLAAAEDFRRRAGAANLLLARADLFALPVPERAFEVVICRGVVHHTPDPDGATRQVCARVAPGGHLVLGFYEAVARLPHRARRALSFGGRRPVRVLDAGLVCLIARRP